MICQVCFEAVEFLPELRKRHYQNYLALCPNHVAMYQHANGSRELMMDLFAEVASNELEVVLAEEDTTIYFTKTHITDLKAVIEADQRAATGDDDS